MIVKRKPSLRGNSRKKKYGISEARPTGHPGGQSPSRKGASRDREPFCAWGIASTMERYFLRESYRNDAVLYEDYPAMTASFT